VISGCLTVRYGGAKYGAEWAELLKPFPFLLKLGAPLLQGYWSQVEVYVQHHTEAQFSHGICPDCVQKLYPELEQDGAGEPKEPLT